MKSTILDITKNNLCTGCGTCVSLCPKEAIKMVIDEKKGIYIPQLNDKCNNCGLCQKVCPGWEVDFKYLNIEIFGNESNDILMGNYISCYTGYSKNRSIRYNSASGGIITNILIYALEKGLINGALVTRMKKDKPLEPESFIARTVEEIIEASKSKYCPVPANIALREIINAKDDERFAVVGLPCHIQGLRKAQLMNSKLKKVILCLGIMCNHSPTFKATEFLLNKYKIKKEDVLQLNYRGDGWPGGLKIVLKNGVIISKIVHDYWASGFGTYFYPIRCTVCCDQTCELSDISFADAWLPEFVNDKIGTSILINRSASSELILGNMFAEKKIYMNKTDRNKLIQSQWSALFARKKFKSCEIAFKLFGKKIPSYNTELIVPNYIDYLKTIILYFRIWLSTKEYLWWMINIEGDLKIKLYNYAKEHNYIIKFYKRLYRRDNLIK